MKRYTVVYAPEARDDLRNIFFYVANSSGNNQVAAQFVADITRYCDGLEIFPMRGIERDEVRPGLRVTNYDGRTVIAFNVDGDADRVSILGVFYGGQDYAQLLNKH